MTHMEKNNVYNPRKNIRDLSSHYLKNNGPYYCLSLHQNRFFCQDSKYCMWIFEIYQIHLFMLTLNWKTKRDVKYLDHRYCKHILNVFQLILLAYRKYFLRRSLFKTNSNYFGHIKTIYTTFISIRKVYGNIRKTIKKSHDNYRFVFTENISFMDICRFCP